MKFLSEDSQKECAETSKMIKGGVNLKSLRNTLDLGYITYTDF